VATERSVPSAPAARDRPRTWPAHCTDIVQRASLGEPLTDDERAILRRDCS
jgi:hypothetical protein